MSAFLIWPRVIARSRKFITAFAMCMAGVLSVAAHAQVMNPAGYNFGTVNLGSNATTTMTFSFTGATAVASVSVVTQGVTGKDFQATSPDSSGTLCAAKAYTSGQSCTVDITFAPLAPGKRLGAAVLRDSSNRILAIGYVTGFGSGAQLGFATPAVSTFVGTGTYSLTNPSGLSGTSAGFLKPWQLAFDAAGNLYIADESAQMIYKVTPAGLVSGVLGSFRSGCGASLCGYPTSNSTTLAASSKVDLPYSIVVDGAGLLWFVDDSLGALGTVDLQSGFVTAQVPGTATAITSSQPHTSGNIHTLSGASLGGLSNLATDGLGNIYVSCFFDGTQTTTYAMILRLDPNGNISLFAGNTIPSFGQSAPADGTLATDAVLGSPWGMGFDGAENFYYYDQLYHQIFKIDITGNVHPFAGSGSIASDNTSGLPYWQSGTASTTANLSVNLAANVGYLAVDPSGNVFLPSGPSTPFDSTSGAPRVFVFTPSGYAYVLAGNGTIGEVNGAASSSEIATPTSVALNGTGDVYISENSIRESSASPAVYIGSSVRKWSMAASTLSFGTQAMGSTSAGQTVTATNMGNAPLVLTTPSSGTNPNPGSSFTLLSNTAFNACGTGSSGGVAVGSDCSVITAFEPHQSSGSISGSLLYSGNLPGGTTSVPMAGTAAPGVASLKLTGLPASATSGAANTVTVSAYDGSQNLFSSYSGTVHFSLSPTDVAASLPSDYTFSASDGGTKTFSVALSAPGAETLNVADTANGLSANQNTTVVSAVDHFAFTTAPPTTTTAGNRFSVTVTAYSSTDSSQVATSYTGPVKFTSSDSNAVLPASGLSLTNGVGAFSITLKTAGTQTITVADSGGSPSVTSSSITVVVAAANAISVVSGRSQSATIGTAFANPLVVQVVDAYSNPVSGNVVTFTVPSSGASATLSASTCTTASSTPVGQCSVTATANGISNSATAYTVTARAAGVTSGATFTLTNKEAATTINLIPTAASIVYGQPVTLNATVSPSSTSGSSPTGSVTFYDGTSTALTPNATVASAAARYTISVPAVGTHTYYAKYLGDTNFSASSQTAATANVAVGKASSTLRGPTTQPVNISLGQSGSIPISVAGQYSGSGISSPSGSVSYSIVNSSNSSVVSGSLTIASGSVTVPVSSTLPTGNYNVNLSYAGDSNYNAATSISVSLQVGQLTQAITFQPPASPVTYGVSPIALSATGGASGNPVTFSIVSGSNAGSLSGTNNSTLTITGVGTIVVAANQAGNSTYSAAPQVTQTVVVDQATPSVTTWPSASAISYGQTLARSALTGGAASVGGTFAFTTPTTAPSAGTSQQSVTFTPTDNVNYKTVIGSVSVVVNKAVPNVTLWPTASAIMYGQSLTNSLLSGGSASVPGIFAFTAPSVAPAAGSATEGVTFTPTDATDYSSVTGTVSVTVNKATPTVTAWPTANSITFGQTLASATLNGGAASVVGSFGFNSPDTEPPAGTASQNVTFTPTDATDYNTVSGTVSVTVNKALPTITTWPSATAITYGQTLANSTLTGGAASVGGTFAFTNSATAPTAGTSQQSVTFTPSDTADYSSVTGAVSVAVSKATPTVTTWPTASMITYGQTLASSTLNGGLGSVRGSFAFTSPASTPVAGAALQSVIFTPTDTTDYNTVSGTVSVTVNKATPTVSTWPTATVITYGQTLANSKLSGGVASVVGGFSFTTPAAAPSAGTTSQGVTFTPTDVTDFNLVSGTVSVTVNQPAQSINFVPPTSPVTFGVSPLVLSATGGASGNPVTFNIISGPGSLSGANNSTLTVNGAGTITIAANQTGNANYLAATQVTQSVLVNPAAQTITFTPPSAVTYGVGTIPLSATGGSSGNPVTFTLNSGPATLTGNTLSINGAGSASVTASQAGTANYSAAAPVTAIITVNKAAPSIQLVSSINPVLVQNSTTLTATVSSTAGSPSGSVTFLDGSTPLNTVALASGVANLPISSLAAGIHSITAAYSGDGNFVAATSAAISEQVQDFNLVISTSSGSGSVTTQTIAPGATANYSFIVSPTGTATFPAAVALTVSGLPSGATYTINPTSIAAGSGSTNVTLTVTVPNQAANRKTSFPFGTPELPFTFAILLLPFARRLRRASRRLNRLGRLSLFLVASAIAMAGLSGCGARTGFFAQPQQSYTVTITGSAGSDSHSTSVTLIVE